MDETKLRVAMLSTPGMGHLIPALLLGTRLATLHNLHVTILVITTPNSPPPSQLLTPGLTSLKIIEIPSPDVSDLTDADMKVATVLRIIMREARPSIRSVISSMSPPADILIADHFGSESWPIADEFGIPKYVYVPSNAWYVGLTMYVPVLDKEVKGQYVDLKEPIKIPGCKPVQPEDIIDPMQDRDNKQYREYVQMGIEYRLADGILMNTWEDLESGTINALRNDETLRSVVKVPVYPIGPLHKPPEPAGSSDYIIEWLDLQPAESVLFVAFGSGGLLSAEQVTELAWGLELSQQRFIWMLRPPTGKNKNADASYLSADKGRDGTSPNYLPDGFLDRTRGVGLIVQTWVPQVQILNHRSVGGFLSHCGWNSSLESIAGGVPMVAWPLYAEQALNATMLTEELRVGVRPETKTLVGSKEIEKLARTLMECDEGKAMRERAKDLKRSGEEALSNGGSSYNSMCELIKDWRLKLEYRNPKSTNQN